MIRFAIETDLEDILEIYNDAILNTTSIYTYEPETLDERLKWYKEKGKRQLPVLVYDVSGKVAGFASYGPFRPYAAYQYSIEHSVYVHREYRNRSIGSSLLHELIIIAKKDGYQTMVGVIDALNEGSRKLHEKFGFEFVGIIQKAGYKFDKWLDVAFYQFDLSNDYS